jgi:hypothetical protein
MAGSSIIVVLNSLRLTYKGLDDPAPEAAPLGDLARAEPVLAKLGK